MNVHRVLHREKRFNFWGISYIKDTNLFAYFKESRLFFSMVYGNYVGR